MIFYFIYLKIINRMAIFDFLAYYQSLIFMIKRVCVCVYRYGAVIMVALNATSSLHHPFTIPFTHTFTSPPHPHLPVFVSFSQFRSVEISLKCVCVCVNMCVCVCLFVWVKLGRIQTQLFRFVLSS